MVNYIWSFLPDIKLPNEEEVQSGPLVNDDE